MKAKALAGLIALLGMAEFSSGTYYSALVDLGAGKKLQSLSWTQSASSAGSSVQEEITVPRAGLELSRELNLKKPAKRLDSQIHISQNRLESLFLENIAGVDGHHRSAPIAVSAKDSVAAARLPDFKEAPLMKDAYQLLGRYGGEALPHLKSNGERRDDGLSGFGNILATGTDILNIGIDSVLHLGEGFLDRVSLNMAAWQGGALGKIAAFFAAFYNHGIVQNRPFPSHGDIITAPPPRVNDGHVFWDRVVAITPLPEEPVWDIEVEGFIYDGTNYLGAGSALNF